MEYLILFGVFVFILIIFSVFSFNKRISKIIHNNKNRIEIIYILASIFTIFSILFGVFSFYYLQEQNNRIKEENYKMIISNLKQETTNNLVVTSLIKEDVELFIETPSFPINRYNYYYLEKSQEIFDDKYLRWSILNTITNMKKSNTLMEMVGGRLFISSSELEEQKFLELKRQSIPTLLEDANKIETFLKRIEKEDLEPFLVDFFA